MVAVVNTVWYCNYGNGSNTGYFAVAAWAASTSIAAGTLVRQNATPTLNQERVFICIVAGTTGSTEPTWVVTKGGKTTDGTVTWQECTGQAAVNGDTVNNPTSAQNRSQTQTLGAIITDGNGFYYICSTAGTAGASAPTWNTTTGANTTDNTVTWTCIGTTTSFAKWAAPHCRIQNSTAISWGNAGGNTTYVANNHAETQAASMFITGGTASGNLYAGIYCVGATGNIPPQASDLTTGATCIVTGQNMLTINQGNVDVYGIAFTGGSGSTYPAGIALQTSGDVGHYTNCAFNIVSTYSGAYISIGGTSYGGKTTWDNCTVSFALSSQGIYFNNASFIWRNSSNTFQGTPLAGGFFTNNYVIGQLFAEAVDFSTVTGTLCQGNGQINYVFKNCKISSAAPFSTYNALISASLDLINCDSGGATYRHERHRSSGNLVMETTAVRTSGASDGTTPISWKITTPAAGGNVIFPFELFPIAIWNAVTGATVTVTIQGIFNGTVLPYNDEIWLETVYLGTASSTLGTRLVGTKANILATHTAQAASTVAWDSAATARANSTGYAVGSFIKLASNTGRLFICITAGTTASSEPAGYASAVDGGSVTDGTATFRALVRFTLTASLSSPQPQAAGYIEANIRVALRNGAYWIDPLITLS